MTPKSPPPTGATPQQEIFQRFPALFSISQKRQPPLPSLRDTAQTIWPANQYSPPPRGSCRLSATGGVFLQKPHHQKGILFSPASSPHRGFQRGSLVSAAASVGDGRSPLALNASPAPPPTRRMSLSCREFRERETRPSKLHKVQLDSFAHPPRACLVRVRCLNLCFLEAGLASPGGRGVIAER